MRVVLSGATGKVGRALEPALREDAEIELVARVAPSLNIDLAAALDAGGVDAVVDFTVPAFARRACDLCIAAGVPLVLGTSGLDATGMEQVDAAARDRGVPVFTAANFAIGAVLMMRFAAQAAGLLDRCEIVELHADTKRDAPSGTALATARRLGGEVPIHSVRLPGLVAHQEVIFGGLGQTLVIRHDTTSRDAFVPGVLLALKRLPALPAGLTQGLDVLL